MTPYMMANQFLNNGSDTIGNMRIEARHMKINSMARHRHELESGVSVNPFVSMGLREDGMLGRSFFGIEMSGGIKFENLYGYELSTRSEVLFAGTEQIQEWGMSGNLSYDAERDELGLQFDISPKWGRRMLADDNDLWHGSGLVQGFDSGMHTGGVQLNAEIGYGFNIWDDLGLLKSFGGVILNETQVDEFNYGSKLSFGPDVELEFKSMHTLYNKDGMEDELKLEAQVKW